MVSDIARNLEMVRRRIARAAARAGRDPSSVTLVGVSKTVPAERVASAVEAGLRDLGENRVQEARDKAPRLPERVRWHLVGHLQSNKATLAARLFDMVHSIDSLETARRLDQAAQQAGRSIVGLVQVDMAGEATKFGVPEADLDPLLEGVEALGALRIRGLMVLPPYQPDPERARPYFRRLRELRDGTASRHPALELSELSMGMTEDFEVAIEEGATLVRVGRALFGERPGKQPAATSQHSALRGE